MQFLEKVLLNLDTIVNHLRILDINTRNFQLRIVSCENYESYFLEQMGNGDK